MNNIDNKYIIDGISIDKTKDGYRVFTIPTQHFNILDLNELTNERFEQEIKRQEKVIDVESEIFKLFYEDTNKEFEKEVIEELKKLSEQN
jgi:hypothetical protein